MEGGRKGLKLVIETVVGMISILMALLFLGGARSGRETIDAGLLVTMFALLPLFGVSALFFIGRYLEKHGYRREDVKRLHVILEENWGRDRFVKDVQEIIGHHIIVWYLLGMALFLTGNVVGGGNFRGRHVSGNFFVYPYLPPHGAVDIRHSLHFVCSRLWEGMDGNIG